MKSIRALIPGLLLVVASLRLAAEETLPKHALAQLGHSGLPHPKGANAAAWMPDGTQLVTAGEDGIIRVWDTKTWKEIHSLPGHKKRASSLAVSLDGKFVISGGWDSVAVVWDTATWTESVRLTGMSNSIRAIAISADGSRVAATGDDIHVFELPSGKPVRTLKQKDRTFYSISFSPRGQELIATDYGGGLTCWDVSSGDEVRTVKAHPSGDVTRLVCSRDGKSLMTAGGDGKVAFWDAGGAHRLAEIQLYRRAPSSLSISPDGRWLACGNECNGGVSEEPAIMIVDIEKKTIEKKIAATNDDMLENVAWSPDGTMLLAVNSDRVRIWETKSFKELNLGDGHGEHAEAVAFSPDSSVVVTGGQDHKVICWDASTGKRLCTLEISTWAVGHLVFADHGRLLVSGGVPDAGPDWNNAPAFSLVVWDTSTWKELRHLGDCKRWIRGLASGNTPESVLTATGDSEVSLWDVTTGARQRILKNLPDGVEHACFSPDGSLLALGGSLGEPAVVLWDVAAGHEKSRMSASGSDTRGLQFAADGKTIAELKGDNTIRLWDPKSGRQITKLEGKDDSLWCQSFSPDGRFIAAGGDDGDIRIWSVEGGKPRLKLKGHTGPVSGLSWSADGRKLASVGWDGCGVVWDVSAVAPEKDK